MNPMTTLTPDSLHPAACTIVAAAGLPESDIQPGNELEDVLLAAMRELFPLMQSPAADVLLDVAAASARDGAPDALKGDLGEDPDSTRFDLRQALGDILLNDAPPADVARLARTFTDEAYRLLGDPDDPCRLISDPDETDDLETALQAAFRRFGRYARRRATPLRALFVLRCALGNALGTNGPWLPGPDNPAPSHAGAKAALFRVQMRLAEPPGTRGAP